MNESEINKLIKDMVKKFSNGGFIDCLRNGGTVSKCKCGKRIDMQQDGGRITRKGALETAMDQMGYSRSQARLAYQNQKNALRNQGLRGAEMRQAARANMMNSQTPGNTPPPLPTLYDNVDIEIEDAPIVINDNPFTSLDSSIPTVQKIDRFGGDFNSAFAAARRSGLDKFY